MSMRPAPNWARVALALTATFALLLNVTAGAAPPPPAGEEPPQAQEGEGNAQVTSFFFGLSDQITPLPPINETTGQTANCYGVAFPRFLLTNVGTWRVTLTEEGMAIEGVDGISIWASSDQGAVNVRFAIQVELNGNSAGTLYTETKLTLSAQPTEFRIDPGAGGMQTNTFPKGAQLSLNLQYQAGTTRGPAGPSSDSTFHYYSSLYRSRVDFITNPFNLTMGKVEIQSDRVNATTIVKDALSVDPQSKIYSLSFDGPTKSLPPHVVLVNTLSDSVNGTSLVWNWEFLKQGVVAQSGSYVIQLTARYAGSETNYSNVSTMDLTFPKARAPSKGVPSMGPAGVVVALAALPVAAVAVRSWRWSRSEER